MMSRPIARRYYEVGIQIEQFLYDGVFEGGSRLPSERELAEQFNASRTVIREAMIMLEMRGLVEVKKGAGIFFVDCAQNINKKSLMPFDDIGPFELLQARAVVEPNITGFAATQVTFSQLRELREILDAQTAELGKDSEKFEELDRQFHNKIAAATHNRLMIRQAADLWRVVRTDNPIWKKLNSFYLHRPELQSQWLEDHRRIFTALQQRSREKAIEATILHIDNSRINLLAVVEEAKDEIPEMDDMFFANAL